MKDAKWSWMVWKHEDKRMDQVFMYTSLYDVPLPPLHMLVKIAGNTSLPLFEDDMLKINGTVPMASTSQRSPLLATEFRRSADRFFQKLLNRANPIVQYNLISDVHSTGIQ